MAIDRPRDLPILAPVRRISGGKGATMRNNELAGDNIQVERKRFAFSLLQNQGGCVVRISEEAGARRSSIMIPASGLELFLETLTRVAHKAPAPAKPPKKPA